ncbi:hypothetical protein BUX70_13540 [Salmonella enterica subsp. enterica serovar Stanley]|nr:hypothetical protein [Salmonella enterica subsp. enterica serovar Stanley]
MHLTVHTVHLVIFLFNIIVISGEWLVKSEQSTLHLCDFFSLWMRTVRRCGGGIKSFFRFYYSHCSPFVFFQLFHGDNG